MQPQQKTPWWKTRKGMTFYAYMAFILAGGFIVLALASGKPTEIGSGAVIAILGFIWLRKAKKLPQ